MQIIDGGSRRRNNSGFSDKEAGGARGDGGDCVERGERKRRRCMEAGTRRETEMPETRVVADGVEGIYVDF